LSLSTRLSVFVAAVGVVGLAAGLAGVGLGRSHDLLGLLALVAVVGVGQALALESDDTAISVSAVGALTGAALFGPRAALPLALAISLVDWSARRQALHYVFFNVATLALAALAAAGVFEAANTLIEMHLAHHLSDFGFVVSGVVAGVAYYAVNMVLLSLAIALDARQRWTSVLKEQFAWLLPHYLGYGIVAGVMAIAYQATGLYALAVGAVPLLLMRKTQAAYLAHTQRSTRKLRVAAETIQQQNVSLEKANRLLKERSTAAMESLSATVDARDAYTAGHSRRVQQLALGIGRELGLSSSELDLLGHAALFHDVGKLAIPDAVLLKPAGLTPDEWALMQRHAEEGARIIERLGFLQDAVPAIRHHHERFDGSGYPDGIAGEEIPLGARVIHVADALDSMLTTRIYRSAQPTDEALVELRRGAGTQFCPRTVAALEALIANATIDPTLMRSQAGPLPAAS
jgi:putative nucleotidyltransferase with HDIG domain